MCKNDATPSFIIKVRINILSSSLLYCKNCSYSYYLDSAQDLRRSSYQPSFQGIPRCTSMGDNLFFSSSFMPTKPWPDMAMRYNSSVRALNVLVRFMKVFERSKFPTNHKPQITYRHSSIDGSYPKSMFTILKTYSSSK